jgi:signal transduction histidine kinase
VELPPDYFNNLLNSVDDLLLVYEYFDKIGDKEIMAGILDVIKTSYFFQSDYQETQQYVNVAFDLYDDLGLVYLTTLYSTYKMRLFYLLGEESAAKKIELELVDLIEKNEDTIGVIVMNMAMPFSNSGRFALSIEYRLKSIKALKQVGNYRMLADEYRYLGNDYLNLDMNSNSAESYKNYIATGEYLNDSIMIFRGYRHLVVPLINLKKYDEARKYMNLVLEDPNSENKIPLLAAYNEMEGKIRMDQGIYAEAIPYFTEAFEGYKQDYRSRWSAPFMPFYIARCYFKLGDHKKSLDYALLSNEMEEALNSNRMTFKIQINLLLSEIYEKLGNRDIAYEFLKIYQELSAASDSLDEANRVRDAEVRAIIDKNQNEIFQLEEDRKEKEQQNRLQRLWIISIAGALISAIILSLILYRNNKNKQKANARLKEQKEEIKATLDKLKSTQSQLIHSEKMASLGELTAGIAHEIQNPLNFVNNFSEVNQELLEELKGERIKVKSERDEQLIEELINDIKENELKINHHGKRADEIVKGMLQHSRTNSSNKELTDIGNLADEYLRLAYHGLRAKDKSFNADFHLEVDENLPKIKVIPQEIGRVLLNLINNAFYAVDKKAKSRGDGFKSEVTVSLKRLNEGIEIRVKDNGFGIPEDVKEKIFQPFFTTKPAGEGTGLGLSLSYEIIKSHGGEIELETLENKGTVFKIKLGINGN